MTKVRCAPSSLDRRPLRLPIGQVVQPALLAHGLRVGRDHVPQLLEPGKVVFRLLAQAGLAALRPQLGAAMTKAWRERDEEWLANLVQLERTMNGKAET